MNGAHASIASTVTGACPFSKSACFTRFTSPIQWKTPGNSASSRSICGRIDTGSARSGNVIDSVRWRSAGACAAWSVAFARSFRGDGVTAVPGQSR